jgi:hypothetical protein
MYFVMGLFGLAVGLAFDKVKTNVFFTKDEFKIVCSGESPNNSDIIKEACIKFSFIPQPTIKP